MEANVKSVEGQRPDILKQVAATKEQIVQAQRERDRVYNLLRVGAANQKQLDDAESLLEVLRKHLAAQNSTLENWRRREPRYSRLPIWSKFICVPISLPNSCPR